MFKDIQTAIETYRKLSPVEKRLFRTETGLDSVKRRGAAAGGKRAAAAAGTVKAPRAPRKPKAPVAPPSMGTALPETEA